MRADLSGLLGLPVREVRARLGAPDADEGVAGERWLVYRPGPATLRVRCARPEAPGAGGGDAGNPAAADGDDELRVSSWVLTLEEGRATLREAAEPWGLWPACRPDAAAAELDAPMARRALPGPEGEETRSFTAGVREGRFVRLALFDEPPDWL